MKYLICLTFFLLSISTFCQNKDTNTKPQIKAIPCQIELAGKLSGGINSTKVPTIKVEEILSDPIVTTVGCANYTITSFQMVTTVDGNTYQRVSSNDHLTDEMIDLIKQVKKGDPIIIQAVHYKLPNGQTGVMPGINLRIQK